MLLPTVASFVTSPLKAGGNSWRRSWNGQLPLKALPLDEALEILYDDALVVPVKRTAAARIHRETRQLLREFKAILKKSNGNLGPYLPRIQYMGVVVPAGIRALAHWGQSGKQANSMTAIWIKDLLKQL